MESPSTSVVVVDFDFFKGGVMDASVGGLMSWFSNSEVTSTYFLEGPRPESLPDSLEDEDDFRLRSSSAIVRFER